MNKKSFGLVLPKSRHKDTSSEDDESVVDSKHCVREPSSKELEHINNIHKKAIEEDPLVFDYDAAYDRDHIRKSTKSNVSKQPKYVHNLMQAALDRKIEREIYMENKIQREREKEGNEYQNKEKFVTFAYKKKLQEMEKWQAERKESQDTVQDMTSFYQSILDHSTSDKDVSETMDSQYMKRYLARKAAKDGQ